MNNLDLKSKVQAMLKEVLKDGLTTIICLPFADIDVFVRYCTIGKDFQNSDEADIFYREGKRVDLTDFLDHSDLSHEEKERIFFAKNKITSWDYGCFRKDGIAKLEKYIGTPIRFVEGANSRYTPDDVIKEISGERLKLIERGY